MRGYHWIGFIASFIANVGECGFYIACMCANGRADFVSCSALLSSVLMLLVNVFQCKRAAFKPDSIPRSCEVEISDVRLKGLCFLRCRGLGGGLAHMRGRQVSLDQCPVMGGVGQEVDMHLVGADLRAFMAQMRQIERDRIVLGVAEGERLAARLRACDAGVDASA